MKERVINKKNLWLLIMMLVPGILLADHNRNQTIQLKKGWNAVYLEVDPEVHDPDNAFANLPVDLIATFYGQISSIQYINDPDEGNWKTDGWHKWIRPDAPDAFLKNLYRIHAGQSYLIHATEDAVWQIKGESSFSRPKWKPNSFNLIGFSIDPNDKPTFAQYFTNSDAHENLLVYDLIDNHWNKISDLYASMIEPGKAYWIYCKGESDFMGPLDITLPLGDDALDYQATGSTLRIFMKNDSDVPVTYDLNPIPGLDNSALVSLSMELRYAVKTIVLDDIISDPNKTLESGQVKTIYLTVRRDRMDIGTYSNLLELTGGGSRFYIPVSAIVKNKIGN